MEFVLKGKAETVFRLIRLMAVGEKLEDSGERLEGDEAVRSVRASACSPAGNESPQKEWVEFPATFLKAFEGES